MEGIDRSSLPLITPLCGMRGLLCAIDYRGCSWSTLSYISLWQTPRIQYIIKYRYNHQSPLSIRLWASGAAPSWLASCPSATSVQWVPLKLPVRSNPNRELEHSASC